MSYNLMQAKEAIRILKDIYSLELAEPHVMRALEALVESSDQVVTNTEILMFISGWQGGTVDQIAKHLGVSTTAIVLADYEDMQDLMRLAQQKRAMNT